MGAGALTVVVGSVSGVLSGAFGIGGGLVTTPAIRLVLGFDALIAVGTPLAVIIPGAVTGAWGYARRGLADVRSGLLMGAAGTLASVCGTLLSARVGGPRVMLATAALIIWAAVDVALQVVKRRDAPAPEPGSAEADPGIDIVVSGAVPHGRPRTPVLLGIGAIAGFYSGFFGLGGGFVVVPALMRFCGLPMRRAVGTSLVTVAVLAVPGTIAHALLGHVDWSLALLLALGVVPGAAIGARLATRATDRTVHVAFAALLALTGLWLAASEMGAALR